MTDRMASYPDDTSETDRNYIDDFKGVPDGSFVQGYVTLVTYVDPDGENRWLVHNNFDLPASALIGMLAMAQVEMMARTPGLVTNLSDPCD